MLVGMDISPIAYGGGVSTYIKELANKLSQMSELDVIFLYMSLRKPIVDLKNVREFKIPAKIYEPLFNDWRIFNIENLLGPVDIYHSSDWVQAKSRAKKVTTVHDVIPLKYPEWSDKKIVRVHRKRMELIEKEIDIVICVSETTKNDLLEVSNLDPNKIRVVYEGVSERFCPLPKIEVEQFKMESGLPDNFVLAIGGIGERRNIKGVRQACERLNIDLVVTGVDIQVSDDQMPLLYGSSKALIYPSFYEGFGLPILEAFGCGVPVVTSNLGAMKEISGSAAVLVDPQSVDSIMVGIERVLDDKKRSVLIKKGIERANLFSWNTCAKETVKIYEELMG